MSEAVKALRNARATAVQHKQQCEASKLMAQAELDRYNADIARMTTRIEEIDAAIQQLGGE